jgi:ribosome-binding factor A
VIAEIVMKEVRNPKISSLVTIKKVEVTKDLRYAKVYISLVGSESEKEQTLKALQSAAGFISYHASKKVVLRYFPSLSFHLDHSLDAELRIHNLLQQIHEEELERSDPTQES